MTQVAGADGFSSTLIFIYSSSIGGGAVDLDSPAIGAIELEKFDAQAKLVDLASRLEELVIEGGVETEVDTVRAHVDDVARAVLFGKYSGQVAARIERAWLPAHSTANPEPFSCQVRIEQDRDGNVQLVELLQCDDDSRWQTSLVAAIERASPLTAPPDPSVFSNQLILSFSTRVLIESTEAQVGSH